VVQVASDDHRGSVLTSRVGGPLDGRDLDVEVDDDGLPPGTS
jgi:hypothetical protein